MHTGPANDEGRVDTFYDDFKEVCDIAYSPPRYCDKDGSELHYTSFYDRLNRFTLKAYCPVCQRFDAVSVKKEKYEEHMLKRWTQLVKERAEYKCEMESKQCSGDLHAHHIIPKYKEPARKYDVENGMCLCAAHHKMIHHYM